MNILLLGSGGREHALAWKMLQSPLCKKMYVAPGNAGTAAIAENVALNPLDFAKVSEFVLSNAINMVVVGPEEPLVRGIVDYFQAEAQLKDIPVIGPSALGAQLEGSKTFAKAFMQEMGIPTAAYREFNTKTLQGGLDYLATQTPPFVLKADGLAAGKGVVILNDVAEAQAELSAMLGGKFGQASEKVVIEQFLSGIEFSVFALTDGKNYLILPEAKDYKRIGEGDTGLNTGGMGAVSPVPFVDATMWEKVEKRIIQPTIAGLGKRGMNYIGVVFFGLIDVAGEPYVIEYNCRLGDPETEAVLPRLQNDLVDLFVAASKGELNEHTILQDPRSAATIILVAGGYPGDYEKGKPISGLDRIQGSMVFHAGTSLKESVVSTNGGRVLAITAYGDTFPEALVIANRDAAAIRFEGVYYRKDIGFDL